MRMQRLLAAYFAAALCATQAHGQGVYPLVGPSPGGAGSGLTITDGTHTVAGTTQVTVSGGTVGGTAPNATLTISASATSFTPGTTTILGGTAPCFLANSTSTASACDALGTGVVTALANATNATGGVQTYDANLFKRSIACGSGTPGSGTPPATGVVQYAQIPYAGTITGYALIGDQSGSVVVDIWKSNAAVPTVANTITASAKPTLSSSQYVNSTTLIGWTTSVAANDVIACNVVSASTLNSFSLTLFVTAN